MKTPHRELSSPEPFRHMLKRIRGQHRSIYDTCRAIGISDQSYYRLMRDGELVAQTGKKILKSFNETILCSNQK